MEATGSNLTQQAAPIDARHYEKRIKINIAFLVLFSFLLGWSANSAFSTVSTAWGLITGGVTALVLSIAFACNTNYQNYKAYSL